MRSRTRWLLDLDGTANLAFGLLVLAAPEPVFDLLGLPWPGRSLWTAVLGAILIGIGGALLLEARRSPSAAGAAPDGQASGAVGLGLGGALIVNLAAALAIAGWWAVDGRAQPPRGHLTLGALVLFLVGLSAAEWRERLRR